MKLTTWSKEELVELEKMYSHGTPLEEISEKLDRTIKAIRNRAYMMGYARMHSSYVWQDAEVELLRSMWADNKTIKEIAGTLGRTEPSVSQKARAIELPRRVRPGAPLHWSDKETKLLKEMHYTGKSSAYMAHKLGRSIASVNRHLKLLGMVGKKSRVITLAKSGVMTGKPSARMQAIAAKYAKRLFAPVDHSPEAMEARRVVSRMNHAKAQRNWVQDMFRGCEIPKSTLKRLGL